MWPFTKKNCAVCAEKDSTATSLRNQIDLLKSQLAHSREREEKAIDALLERQGVESVTPTPRMTAKDADDQQRQAFALFVDEDDKGDGAILEVDRLNVERSPLG